MILPVVAGVICVSFEISIREIGRFAYNWSKIVALISACFRVNVIIFTSADILSKNN